MENKILLERLDEILGSKNDLIASVLFSALKEDIKKEIEEDSIRVEPLVTTIYGGNNKTKE